MSTSYDKNLPSDEDLTKLFNLIFDGKTDNVITTELLASFLSIDFHNVSNNLDFIDENGNLSKEKLLSKLHELYSKNQNEINFSIFKSFIASLQPISKMEIDFDYFDELKKMTLDEYLSQHIIHKKRKNKATTQIENDPTCFRNVGDDANTSTLVIAVSMHGDDSSANRYEPSSLPNGNKIGLHHYAAVPCGFYNYVSCGTMCNRIEEMESALKLRGSTDSRAIDYVDTKMAKYVEPNSELFKRGSELGLQVKLEFQDLNKSDFFTCGIPVMDRKYALNPSERSSFDNGLRILKWGNNNSPADTIFDKMATPNFIDPNVSSVHLLDNTFVAVRDFRKQSGRTPAEVEISSEKSLKENLKDNGMTEPEYEEYYYKRFDPLFDLEKEDKGNDALNHILALDELTGNYVFTLQDLTDLAASLNYTDVVVIDLACRESGSLENHKTAVNAHEQKKTRYGGESHKKNIKKKQKNRKSHRIINYYVLKKQRTRKFKPNSKKNKLKHGQK